MSNYQPYYNQQRVNYNQPQSYGQQYNYEQQPNYVQQPNYLQSNRMPQQNVMMVQYNGRWCKIERISEQEITFPADINMLKEDKDFKMTNLVVNTGVGAGYSVLTLTDYALKLLSSLSPAYEATIDELMFSKGADTVPVIMKFTWLPKFPIVYVKKYINIFKTPNNGPLNEVKENIIQHIK